MSLRLLLDEDSQDRILVAKLRKAGHEVVTAKEANLLGRSDFTLLAYAVANNYVVLTRNCDDFSLEAIKLKSSNGHHHGILLRYEKNTPDKDMTYEDIVRAVGNIDNAVNNGQLVLANAELSLSYYRY